jgi:Holliday junction resolvase
VSTATRGRALEHEIRKIFEAAGYSVIRGAASKGFFDSPEGQIKPDLIASKVGTSNKYEVQIIALQCKVQGKRKPKKEIPND